MKYVFPDYYPRFQCIAGDCRHSCCIGWEIDIDPETMEYYRTVQGSFGHRLRDNIVEQADMACFALAERERCPFLNQCNLCDIYINLGEEHLCQICSDHPRYRNFFTHRTEVGLGLCCEAAGRLILGQCTPVKWMEEDDGEDELPPDPAEMALLCLRKELVDILQDRTRPLEKRLKEAGARCGGDIPAYTPAQWAQVYRELERLDPMWDKMLDKLSQMSREQLSLWDSRLDVIGEQLAVYFMYRHLADGLEDGRIAQRVRFALLSTRILLVLMNCSAFPAGEFSLENAVETARMYSSEIEYDEENINTLLEQL